MKPKNYTFEDVLHYAETNHTTLGVAQQQLGILTGTSERCLFIRNFINRTGKSIAAGEYAWQKIKDGKTYHTEFFKRRRGYHSIAEVEYLKVYYDPNSLGGYKILNLKTNRTLKTHLISGHVYFLNPNTKKQLSLSALIYILYNQEEIPEGYVVDHVDNNPFNNNPENLQLLTWDANVKKDAVGHNQHTTKRFEDIEEDIKNEYID